MDAFVFNKMYIIESLKSNETKSGELLYNDLIRWRKIQIDGFDAELVQIQSKQEFFEILERIRKECKLNGVYPIIHFEIHGSQNGLAMASNEMVLWKELYDYLVSINLTIGNNLFMTLAVCQGAYMMQLIQVDNHAPFWGFVGSFDVIYVTDLMARYNEFYDEFLDSKDLDKAIERLHNANPGVPSQYRFINSEMTFISLQKKYFDEKFTDKAIKERANDGLEQTGTKLEHRWQRRELMRKFKKRLFNTKKTYFEKHKKVFFMHDEFSENKKRFKVQFSEI